MKNRKSLSKLNHNTYLLIFEDEDRTIYRDWDEKNREIWDCKTDEEEGEKKMNWRDSCWNLYCVFTNEILNNNIFNQSVGDFLGEFTLKFSFHTKIFKKPSRIFTFHR